MKRHRQLLRWLSQQGEETISVIFADAGLDTENLFKSIAKVRHKKMMGGRRKLAVPFEELKEIHRLRIDRVQKKRRAKKPKKALIIERQYYIIKKLREEGGQWEDILEYLKRYHSLNVSRGYFMNVWKELEERYSKES